MKTKLLLQIDEETDKPKAISTPTLGALLSAKDFFGLILNPLQPITCTYNEIDTMQTNSF